MVEVFKTNVYRTEEALVLTQQLQHLLPGSHIHFDLEDCDCILRVEGAGIEPDGIIAMLDAKGYLCERLN